MISPAMSFSRKYPILNQDSKSPAMLPPGKDPILNQDSKIIINKEDLFLTTLLEN